MKAAFAVALLALLAGSLLNCPTLLAAEAGEQLPEAGTSLDMPDGSRLNLQIEDLKVRAHFVDESGVVLVARSDSIVLEVKSGRNKGWRTVLVPAEGAMLAGPRVMTAPHIFEARVIVRLKEGGTKTFPNALLDLTAGGE